VKPEVGIRCSKCLRCVWPHGVAIEKEPDIEPLVDYVIDRWSVGDAFVACRYFRFIDIRSVHQGFQVVERYVQPEVEVVVHTETAEPSEWHLEPCGAITRTEYERSVAEHCQLTVLQTEI